MTAPVGHEHPLPEREDGMPLKYVKQRHSSDRASGRG